MRHLDIAAQIDIPVVISSALTSAVGIAAGLAAASALPNLEHAWWLGTGGLFVEDVVANPASPGRRPAAGVPGDTRSGSAGRPGPVRRPP